MKKEGHTCGGSASTVSSAPARHGYCNSGVCLGSMGDYETSST